MNALGRVAGKRIVVTGAAQGIGAAAARRLAAEGAEVVGLDVADRPSYPVTESLTYRRLDVASADDWAEFGSELQASQQRVDGLLANAGITWRARLGELRLEDLHRVIDVNVAGVMFAIQTLSPLMSVGGSIVAVGSAAGFSGHYPVAYTASKWALRGLARAACVELGRRGIRINTIHPGFIETEMAASAPDLFRALSVEETPLGRPGTPPEVAALVLFLLSDESSYISGAEIPIDGGLVAHNGVKRMSDALLELSETASANAEKRNP